MANAQKAGDWHPDLDAYDMGQVQVASAAKSKRATATAPKAKRHAILVSSIAGAKPLRAHPGTALDSTCGNSIDDVTDFFNPQWMPLARLRNLASDNCGQASHPASSRRTDEPTGAAAEVPERDRFSRDGDCTLADEMNHSSSMEENLAAEREYTTSRDSFARRLITPPFTATEGNPF